MKVLFEHSFMLFGMAGERSPNLAVFKLASRSLLVSVPFGSVF